MKTKTLEKVLIGLFTCLTLLSCNPNMKESEMPKKQETPYVEQTQKNEEKQIPKPWYLLSREGASVVKEYKESHDEAIDKTGVGKFYGSESCYTIGLKVYHLSPYQAVKFEKLLSDEEFTKEFDNYSMSRRFLIRNKMAAEKAKTETTKIKPPAKTDCLEWCLLNLKKTHTKADMNQDWEIVISKALEKSRNTQVSKKYDYEGVIGVELAKILAEAGWTGIYYNPDTNLPSDKPAYIPDPPEKSMEHQTWQNQYMKWTEHTKSYDIAKKHKEYYGIPLTAFVINYRPTTELIDSYMVNTTPMTDEGAPIQKLEPIVLVKPLTTKQTDKLEQLKNIPFGFLLTRGGNHCAIYSYGKVYEVHRDKGPSSKELIEVKDFETEWQWLSGIIMIPPGEWK